MQHFQIFSKEPEWHQYFFCSLDYKVHKKPEHIKVQPSKVKVTHVYNQSVWSDVPSTGTQVTQFLVNAETGPGSTTTVTSSDIRTLLQVMTRFTYCMLVLRIGQNFIHVVDHRFCKTS